MKRLLIKYHRQLTMLACVLFIGICAMAMAGCGVPTWLSDASQIIGMVGTSVTAIGAFIAGLTGNAALAAALATISAWITKVETGIADLEELVSQYNAAPTPGLLANIEAALADVSANLATDFSNLGLPSGILNVIAGIAALALSQLEAWGSLIPALQAKPMASFTIKTPYTKAEYKALVNKILTTPTGDKMVDAALAKVKKM
jgi:hypothetical protein